MSVTSTGVDPQPSAAPEVIAKMNKIKATMHKVTPTISSFGRCAAVGRGWDGMRKSEVMAIGSASNATNQKIQRHEAHSTKAAPTSIPVTAQPIPD